VALKIVASLTEDSRGVIYDRNIWSLAVGRRQKKTEEKKSDLSSFVRRTNLLISTIEMARQRNVLNNIKWLAAASF